MRRGASGLAPWVGLVLAASACTDISTSPEHVAALEFDALPYPAVVAGDTLRDSLGVAAPLKAIAFSGTGAIVDPAPIQYIALDTGVTLAGGIVVAQRRSGSVRLIAIAGNLQSPTRSLLIARRPDSVVATGRVRDTVAYVVPDAATTNVSSGLGVRVVTRDTAGGVTATQGWTVSYSATFRGLPLGPADTSVAYLLDDGTRRSGVDTTGADGTASRRVRIRPLGIIQSAIDSVVVVATVRHRGREVPGSPIRFVVVLRPK